MATNARLHWFWRGTLAVLAGLAVFVLCLGAVDSIAKPAFHAVQSILARVGLGPQLAEFIAVLIMGLLPALASVAAVYGLLASRYACQADGELHCRRCHHILRGLSEPRCPECGEAI